VSLLQLSQKPAPRKRLFGRERFEDEARFLRSWIERPLLTGAVAPSSKYLAQAMASYIDPRVPGPVIELGPGTGPVTDALVRRGIEQERLVLVEYNPEFAQLLKRRFPRAAIVCGDAYDVRDALADVVTEPCAGFISSLPLFTKPMPQRLELLCAAHELSRPGAPFVQFTYAVVPPMPARSTSYTATPSERIWRNMPPARVWVYRSR
jgi:phosphatidylethanolamine/phosphatidyl-N-methylethanolamine N-methyltransferase